MANRTMETKALKLRRQLRKLPRRINHDTEGTFEKWSGTPIPKRLLAGGVSVPRTPNRELMQGYKHRSQSLGMDDVAARFKGCTPARKAAIERSAEVAEQIETVCENMQSFMIVDTRAKRVRVFFNPQKTQFMLVEWNFNASYVRRSMVYGSKVHLIDDFKSASSRLVWVESNILPGHCKGG